jgi:hypothetical protein
MLSNEQYMHSPSSWLLDPGADPVLDSNGASRGRAERSLSTAAQRDHNFRADADHGEHKQRELFLGTNSMPASLRDESSQVGSVHDSLNRTIEDAILRY